MRKEIGLFCVIGWTLLIQLEDGHTLFDYDVGLNDIVQLMICPGLSKSSDTAAATTNGEVVAPVTMVNSKENGPVNCNWHSESEDESMDMVGLISHCLLIVVKWLVIRCFDWDIPPQNHCKLTFAWVDYTIATCIVASMLAN